ncbi:hypothetical protein PHMEG_0006006 [Phytophthora megakarya]|uniref:Uncharacterized protein n=1 Tax=Phytophthora megakarya TaxID=4795 RepID=A0A225WRL3_9STRA|nr:hypothetical protein PHMEG_0006006 [Phytophthora megakarya]
MPRHKSKHSNISADSQNSLEPWSAKKRKASYIICKVSREEQKALREEIVQLEAQLAVLKTQGMPAGSSLSVDPGMQQAEAKSKVLVLTAKQRSLAVATAQSLMTECMRAQYSNPLCTCICLKKDIRERRTTLLAIREEKLQNAYDYVVASNSHTPEGRGKNSSEIFQTDNGDVCCLGNTVVHFPGVQSLKQVYDAIWFYLTNMEISISERLGHVAVRDDYDMLEGSAYNSRILSTDNNGITTETNTVVFVQLFEKGDPRFGGEPCAIVASDCVDEDELYPYRPSEHIRKDISGAVVMTANKQKKQSTMENQDVEQTDEEEELVDHYATCRFPVAPLAQQELESGIGDWGKVMINTIREILYARVN